MKDRHNVKLEMNTRNGSKHHKIEIILKIFAMFLEELQRIPVKSKGFIIELES